MDRNKNGFADITIPGEGAPAGVPVPEADRGRYRGRGAYPRKSTKEREEVCLAYSPSLALIKEVKVLSWGARRSFYERFREDALRYRELVGVPSEFVPFFSYIPQYAQMNLYQSNFYLWFRECARRGEFIPTDMSYILLYAYEIINLSDVSEDREGDADRLCALWMAYRDSYPALDKYMSEWVTDFCLLYGLGVPGATLQILPRLCECATLKEFYMSGAVGDGGVISGEVLLSFAYYDYRRSRVEIPSELTVHFPRAMEEALSAYEGDRFVAAEPVCVTRDAFCGSLSAHNVKRKLTVSYYPAFRKSGAAVILGAVVKYTENKLRRVLGIRSRLRVEGLPDSMRERIDSYFSREFPLVFGKTRRDEPQVPEYEHLYDAPHTPLTADAASRIELESRAAAELLAAEEVLSESVSESAADTAPTETAEVADTPAAEHPKTETDAETGIGETVRSALRHMLEGGGLEEFCRERGLLPDTVAGEINEAAADIIGDAFLEYLSGVWQIIPDYAEEAAEVALGED